MGIRRTLAATATAAAAALLLFAPVSASADDGGHGGGDGHHAHAAHFSATGVGYGQESSGPGSTNPTGLGCQFGGTCEVDTTGQATVIAGDYTFPATYSSRLFINYAAVTFPTPTTYCAPATGTVTITSNVDSADQIYKSESGQVCGGTAAGASHTFSGTYRITGGSGRFHGATGSGAVQTADNGQGQVISSQESGTISYPGAHDGEGDGGDS
ncbi:MAG: hypothetical protein ACYDCI_03220 [Candidatus Limnocylindrales bacterium]